jgi:hypothetical protein
MSTAQTLIDDALYAIGVLGQGDAAPSTADRNLGLRRLQRMLDLWAADGLLVYSRTRETITLASGDATYTTASLSTATRPQAIEGGFIRYGDVDYPLTFVTRSQWNTVGYKSTQGIPEFVIYEPAMTAGTFEFYPVPSDSMTAYLDVRRVLTGTLALDTELGLPPGYEAVIVDNLAIELCHGGFGVQPTPMLVTNARAGKKLLRVLNYQPLIMRSDLERDYNIQGDI